MLLRPIAYSYVRLSSLRQLEGHGLERQLRAKEFAEKHGWDLRADTTLMDLGKSGFFGEHRRGDGALAGFLEAVHEGRVQEGSYLIIEALDRFSRENPMDIIPEFLKLLNAGINIVTLVDEKIHRKEDYHSNWTTLIYSMAQFAAANDESVRKQYRQLSNWEKKREKAGVGQIITARIPKWLKIVEVEGKKQFRTIPDRVALVERIFEELADGLGRGTIAKRLNDPNQPGGPIPPFQDGDGWHGGTVQKITTSRTVLGEYQPMRLVRVEDSNGVLRKRRAPVGDPIKDYYPQIISDDLWIRAQKASKARRCYDSKQIANAGGRIGTRYSNLFREVARCSACGANMVYKRNKRGLPYLYCSRRRRKMCDNETNYYYDGLENAVVEWVNGLDLSEVVPNAGNDTAKKLGTRVRSRDEIQTKINKLLDEFTEKSDEILGSTPGPITSKSVARRVEALEADIEKLDQEIAQLQTELNRIRTQLDDSDRQAAVAALREKMSDDTITDQQKFAIRSRVANAIREVVDTMRFDPDGAVTAKVRNAKLWYVFRDGELVRIHDKDRDGLPPWMEEKLVRTPFLSLDPIRDVDILTIKPPHYNEIIEQLRQEISDDIARKDAESTLKTVRRATGD